MTIAFQRRMGNCVKCLVIELDKHWELTIKFSKMGAFRSFERKEIIISSETQKTVNQGSIVRWSHGFVKVNFK